MAITATLSQKEMARVAAAAYEGKSVRISLANDIGNTLTSESLVSSWDALKVSGGGYADYYATVQVGAYDVADARYEMPQIDAAFTATGGGYTYNRMYVVIGTYTNATITNTQLTANVATITTSGAHGFSVNDVVLIDGTTDPGYEGFYTITAVTSNTLSYDLVAANKTLAASTGTASVPTEETYLHSLVSESPSVSLLAGQTQTYRVLLATDN